VVRARDGEPADRRLGRAPEDRSRWWVSHPVPDEPALRLELTSAGSRAVLTVAGELDVATVPHFEAFVAERSLTGCAVLDLDLAGLTVIASAGLAAVLELQRDCARRGIGLRLCGAQPSVARVFALSGLIRLFTWDDAPAERVAPQDSALF
jgi:anti-sigma B factor antagonist